MSTPGSEADQLRYHKVRESSIPSPSMFPPEELPLTTRSANDASLRGTHVGQLGQSRLNEMVCKWVCRGCDSWLGKLAAPSASAPPLFACIEGHQQLPVTLVPWKPAAGRVGSRRVQKTCEEVIPVRWGLSHLRCTLSAGMSRLLTGHRWYSIPPEAPGFGTCLAPRTPSATPLLKRFS